jgi:putative protease
MAEGKWKRVGKVAHYYTRIGVAIVDLSSSLGLGDTVSIVGANTDFSQSVDSMQIEHEAVTKAKKGDSIGLKVSDRCRKGDKVFKLS